MSYSSSKSNKPFTDARNNPGNLRAVDSKTQSRLTQPGYVLDRAIGFDKNGFAIFKDPKDGMEAMERQLKIDAGRGLTGRQMITKYAPPSDNNPTDAYVKNVFGGLGLDPDSKIDQSKIGDIQRLMVRQEHGPAGERHYFDGQNMLAASRPAEDKGPSDAMQGSLQTFAAMNPAGFMAMKAMRAAFTKAGARPDAQSARAFKNTVFDPNFEIPEKNMSESKIRFKDLRNKIYEQIIINEQLEKDE